ncbi:hypothetical protein [Clostridium rectalis]|uniref:hypothetical protein n=1 Tax=Clostridium rectalis TaxID=2040295 RepID=UPI000F643D95|nr:hypothetical protein [Clostridium rectalis]
MKSIKSRIKFIAASILVVSAIQISNVGIGTVHAENVPNYIYEQSNVNVIRQKISTDFNKSWNINFNSEIDYNSISDAIQVNEVNNESLLGSVPVNISKGNMNSLNISPPPGGYKKGQLYQITVKKGTVRNVKGKSLLKDNIMRFSIEDINTFVSDVVVSPVLPEFKCITISDTTRADVKKYKIEGNDAIFDIGETSINMIQNKSLVKVEFYDSTGYSKLGSADLNVDKTMNHIVLNIK